MIGRMTPTIYVTDSCIGCAQVKQRLAKRPDVQVTLKNATKPGAAQSELMSLRDARGNPIRTVPTMIGADGRVYTNPTEIIQALGI